MTFYRILTTYIEGGNCQSWVQHSENKSETHLVESNGYVRQDEKALG